MKTINLKKPASGQYSKDICLGNGCRLTFTSKRQAGYFVAATNQFLTKCLVVLNSTFADVFFQYRTLWLITSNGKHGSMVNAGHRERKVNGLLHSTGDMLDKFNATFYGNDPFFSFIDLQKTALFCGDAADELSEYFKKRNFTANAYQCQMLVDRCQAVYNNLKLYGFDKKTPASTAGANLKPTQATEKPAAAS